MLLDNIDLLKFPKFLLQHLTTPIQYGVYKSGKTVSSQFDFVFLTRKMLQENKAMQKQLADLMLENADLRRKLVETESLVDQQNSINPKTFNLLAARPIGLGRFLTIDKGSEDGVILGQAVIFKDVYLGQVKEVSPKSAQVILPADPNSKLAVFAHSKTGKAKGILLGQFGEELLMDKILHQEAVEVGDLVYSEGTEGKLPRGLILGKVNKVFERQNEVFKQAEVSPIFKIDDLDLVFILRN